MRKSSYLIIFVLLFLFVTSAYSQIGAGRDDSTKIYTYKNVSSKPSGLFITPFIGMDFPIKTFSQNSQNALSYGARLEFASLSIYPIILFGQYQFHNHPGKDAFKSQYYLNSMETRVSAVGGGVYILLNKYLKMNFTSPFITGEINYFSINRILSPDIEIPDLKKIDSRVAFTAGLGFTLYIFDIITSYNFAGEYSSLAVRTQFHFPLVKF